MEGLYMYENIEKKYKKNLRNRKFNKFYWFSATILIFISSFFKDYETLRACFIYVLLFTLVIGYFIFDYNKVLKAVKIKKRTKLINRLNLYTEQAEKIRIDSLINSLKEYNFKTKNDLKLIIDYYNSMKPLKIESDYLGWIVSIALTLSSFLEIAYDSQTQKIDYTKISVILGSTIGIIIGFMIPIIIFKKIIDSAILPKEKLHSKISEDLSHIYINFDNYKNQLSKK